MTYWILSKLIRKHNFTGSPPGKTMAPDLLARPTGPTPIVQALALLQALDKASAKLVNYTTTAALAKSMCFNAAMPQAHHLTPCFMGCACKGNRTRKHV